MDRPRPCVEICIGETKVVFRADSLRTLRAVLDQAQLELPAVGMVLRFPRPRKGAKA